MTLIETLTIVPTPSSFAFRPRACLLSTVYRCPCLQPRLHVSNRYCTATSRFLASAASIHDRRQMFHRSRPFLNLVHLPLDLTPLPSMPFYLLAPFPVPEETLTTYLLICHSSIPAFLATPSTAPVHLLDNLRAYLGPAVYKFNSMCPLPGVSVSRLP